MYLVLHVMYPPLTSDLTEIWVFSSHFWKMFKYQILWKSVQWEPTCSMWRDGRTNRHDGANSRFRIFANAPTNGTTLKLTKWDFSFRVYLR